MFEYPQIQGAELYQLQVIEDTSTATFAHPLIEKDDSSTATVISKFQFGKKYLWRYTGYKNGKKTGWNGPYNFEIVTDTLLNKSALTMRIFVNSSTDSNALFVMDGTHSAIDRTGKVVWYLPHINWHLSPIEHNHSPQDKIFETRPRLFDLRLTPYGTITYLADSNAIESDLDGNILWRAPNTGQVSSDVNEAYNHDFKHLPNGNYMVLGTKWWQKLPTYKDTALVNKKYPVRKKMQGHEYAKAEFATLIEYDAKGKVVWSWNSQPYFDKNLLSPPRDSGNYELKAHVNAFNVDSKNEFVYMGFRDISRIIKINKKTGKVVYSWGDKLKSGEAIDGNGFFHKQHDIAILKNSDLAVFNNNAIRMPDTPSSVVVFSEPFGKNKSQIKWKFTCQFDTLPRLVSGQSGGNVEEMRSGNLLVCMGNGDRIFEITRDKKLVWDAVLTSTEPLAYMYFHRLYRAHYTSSLYPCYFTATADKGIISTALPELNIKIFNEGSEADAYTIHVNGLKKDIGTPVVNAGQSTVIRLRPPRQNQTGGSILISIHSNTNTGLIKNVVIALKK